MGAKGAASVSSSEKVPGTKWRSTREIGRQLFGVRLHIGIAVDGDDFGARFEQARIAARAKSAIDDAAASERSKCSHNLIRRTGM